MYIIHILRKQTLMYYHIDPMSEIPRRKMSSQVIGIAVSAVNKLFSDKQANKKFRAATRTRAQNFCWITYAID